MFLKNYLSQEINKSRHKICNYCRTNMTLGFKRLSCQIMYCQCHLPAQQSQVHYMLLPPYLMQSRRRQPSAPHWPSPRASQLSPLLLWHWWHNAMLPIVCLWTRSFKPFLHHFFRGINLSASSWYCASDLGLVAHSVVRWSSVRLPDLVPGECCVQMENRVQNTKGGKTSQPSKPEGLVRMIRIVILILSLKCRVWGITWSGPQLHYYYITCHTGKKNHPFQIDIRT